jgi:histidine triad (HIT) family protein
MKRSGKRLSVMSDCIFCRIAAHEAPAAIIHPQAPIHLLVIPRKHITSLNDDLEDERDLLGYLLTVVGRTAREQGIDGSGFRTVINTNAEAGQSVFHLHIHILGGRRLRWPPG